MQAIILAGGLGTRLLPLTKDVPKPLVPICGKPVLDYILASLKDNGITDVIICSGYKSEALTARYGNGDRFGLSITYSKENEPLGTAGPLSLINPELLNDDFFLIYGDVVFNINLKTMMSFHCQHRGIATLFVHRTDHPHDSDIVLLNKMKEITGFLHKPTGKVEPISSAALYVLNKSIVKYISKNIKSDFIKNVFPKALNNHRLYGYYSEEYVKDMGTLDRLKAVEQDVKRGVLNGC